MTIAKRLTTHPASSPIGRLAVAIASGKGGVGKTWLAITLAHAMAAKGRRVLLFDADLGLANVDIQLGLEVKSDLGDVVAGRLPLAECIAPFAAGGFDVVAGKSGSGLLADLAGERLDALRRALAEQARRYDRVILDIGAGIERGVRAMIPRGATTVVVATAEPTSLTDAYAFVKTMLAQAPGCDVRVVINLAESENEGRRTYDTLLKACRSFLKASPPLLGVVRRDARVPEAIRRQLPLFVRSPGSDAGRDVEAMARRLLESDTTAG